MILLLHVATELVVITRRIFFTTRAVGKNSYEFLSCVHAYYYSA